MIQHAGGSSKATGVRWEFQKGSRIHYSMQAVHTHEDEKGTSGRTNPIGIVVKIVDDGLDFYFHFFILFYFILFCFVFLFLEQLRLGFICHTVTSVTSQWRSHKINHGTWENGVEGSEIK